MTGSLSSSTQHEVGIVNNLVDVAIFKEEGLHLFSFSCGISDNALFILNCLWFPLSRGYVGYCSV
jgi:hypothetical protein